MPVSEIEGKDFNLNIPRYIDSQEEEDIQDIDAHLKGGIPMRDIDALQEYWDVYPGLKKALFAPDNRKGYSKLKADKSTLKSKIFDHPEFTAYTQEVFDVFEGWKKKVIPYLKALDKGVHPKQVVRKISEDLLERFSRKKNLQLIDKYDVYQHLMSYWSEVMQDDVFVIADEGLKVGGEVYRITKVTKDKGGKAKEKEVEGLEGIESKLIRPGLIVDKYFRKEKEALEAIESQRESIAMELEELEEEHGSEEGLLADAKNDKDKITAANVKYRLKQIKTSKADAEERENYWEKDPRSQIRMLNWAKH